MKAIRLYAQVLIDVVSAPSGAATGALQSGYNLDRITAELGQFVSMLKESPLFLKVFDNPTLADEDKQKALSELVKRTDVSALTGKFLSLVAKRNRMGILPEILHEVEVIQVEKKGGLIGSLVSAIPLEPNMITEVAAALSKKLNKPVQLKAQVDASLIAGMRVTVAGTTFDGSVKSKFEKLTGSFR